ncbi:MAG: hypothetical protein GY816_07315 [Cytophagales bacterium]|nr:hypothetical protein [Cytophagales bacterium]
MGKSDAHKWVKKYKKKHPMNEDPTYGWLYGADILETLLAYDGVDRIWFFKGIDDDGSERLVLYPADVDGEILDKSMNSLGAAAAKPSIDEPADSGQKCPPHCP